MIGMTMEKIAITVPREALAKIRAASRRAKTSLSAYLASAGEAQVELDDLDALLEEMRSEHGPTTPARRRAAERALLGTRTKSRRK